MIRQAFFAHHIGSICQTLPTSSRGAAHLALPLIGTYPRYRRPWLDWVCIKTTLIWFFECEEREMGGERRAVWAIARLGTGRTLPVLPLVLISRDPNVLLR